MSDSVKQDIIKVGKAMLAIGLQNTHCGNVSVRVGDEIFITKTGSMKGHLKKSDVVTPGLFSPKSGLFQASSETGTHQKILAYSNSVIHAHSLSATLISFIQEEVLPIDILGKSYLKLIPVIAFEYPVGSKQMEEEIPTILKQYQAMIIKTHGPMVRGKTIWEAFHLLNLTDHSTEICLNLAMLKVSPDKIPEIKYPKLLSYSPPRGHKETGDSELIHQFKLVAADAFNMKLSPIHTGSISVRDGKEMLFSPLAATPDYLENDIYRIDIHQPLEEYFHRLHQAVYRYSHSNSAVFTHSPQALVQGFYSLSKGEDRIIPIDAEGGYLYPAIPISLPDEDMKRVVEKAERYKMVLIAGIGVLALGNTPTHCIHHNSSLKNISYLKTQLNVMQLNGIINDIERFLDDRGKEW